MVQQISPLTPEDAADPAFDAVLRAIAKHENSAASRARVALAQKMDKELEQLEETLNGGPVKVVRPGPAKARPVVAPPDAGEERGALSR